MSTFSALRVLAAVTVAPVVAWTLHLLFQGIEDLLLAFASLPDLSAQLAETDWRVLLVSVYSHIVIGFVLAGVAAKFTPALNQLFVRLTILGSIGIGVLIAMTSNYGTLSEIALGASLVVGTVGYGLRMRGFSERVYPD